MKAKLKAMIIGLLMIPCVVVAQSSSQHAAELRAVKALFPAEQQPALEAAAVKTENPTSVIATEHMTKLENILSTAKQNSHRAVTQKQKEDVAKFISALEAAGVTTKSSSTTASATTPTTPMQRSSGTFRTPQDVQWDNDSEAPEYTDPSEEHLRFSGRNALLDAGLTPDKIRADGGTKAAAEKLLATATTKSTKDKALYALAASTGYEYLKGGAKPSTTHLMVLEVCGGQVVSAGKGTARQQASADEKLREGIQMVLAKADGIVSSSAFTTPAISPAPALPATTTLSATTSVTPPATSTAPQTAGLPGGDPRPANPGPAISPGSTDVPPRALPMTETPKVEVKGSVALRRRSK